MRSRDMQVRAVVCALALSSTAHAQVAAGPPRDREPVNVGLGARLAFGEAVADGIDNAWVARLEYDLFAFITPSDRPGPLTGFTLGADYWRAGHGTWGTSVPFQIVLGFRASHVRVTGGLGVDALLIDQVHGDTGVGFYAPLASISAGLDVYPFTVLADARVTRRWQIGADDFTQWMFTLSVGYSQESHSPPGGVK